MVAVEVDPAAEAVNCIVFEVPPSVRLVVLIDSAPVCKVKVNIYVSNEDVFLRTKL